MTIGVATTMIGFGGHGSDAYKTACSEIAEIVGKYTKKYDMLSFVQVDGDLYAVSTKGFGTVVDAAKKQVSLPALSGITERWMSILEEVSAALQDTIVTIFAEGETQAALNGKIFK